MGGFNITGLDFDALAKEELPGLTVNQIKTFRKAYLRDTPTVSLRLAQVARAIALGELVVLDEFRDRIFNGVSHYSEKVQGGWLDLIHGGPKGMDKENFSLYTHNLEEILRKDSKAQNVVNDVEESFYGDMSNLRFLPNSPTLMNAGRPLGQLSGCYVLPIDDNIEAWGDGVKHALMIHKSGGGTGFSFSRVRPQGDAVSSTVGVASGPLSPLRIIAAGTEEIKQGGTRRGANMGILQVDHPDILKFIGAKNKKNRVAGDHLDNFNLSVGVTEEWFRKAMGRENYILIDPWGNKRVGELNAGEVFDNIIRSAHETGDPGIVFLDRLNSYRSNPTPALGQVESTNPCVAGDSLIPSEHGLIRMDELAKKSENVEISLDASQIPMGNGTVLDVCSGKISKAWQTGIKNIFKLVTKSGFELEATADHKILTIDGWKELRDLKFGERIVLQSREGLHNKNFDLPVKFKKLNKWSREFGQIMGLLVGDGWIRKKDPRVGFCFGSSDTGIMSYFKEKINQIYGADIKEIYRKNNAIHLSYHSREFVELFEKLGIKIAKADKKEVPYSIFTAPKEAVVGFLQGLFTADGTISVSKNKTHYIRLTSKSERLLKQTQMLLINLGIKSTIYPRHREKRLMFGYKNIMGEYKYYECDGRLFELQISKDMIPLFLNKIGFVLDKHNEKIKKLEKIRFHKTNFEDEVVLILNHGQKPVFDLNEPVTHSFICNGIIVHNCGEQPLLPYESCNLGSINLSKFIKDGTFDYPHLEQTIKNAVRFLDDVITMNRYPLPQIEKVTKGNRKIGLGVMGWAEAIAMMGISYNSPDAIKLAGEVMGFIDIQSMTASEELAKKRGVFPNFKSSVFDAEGDYFVQGQEYKPRNAGRTTIAPTGTIGIAAGIVGTGIEPPFMLIQRRLTAAGIEQEKRGESISPENFFKQQFDPFMDVAKTANFWGKSEEEFLDILLKNNHSIHGLEFIPQEVRKLFLVSHDLTTEEHIDMQAAFQKSVDHAVSKTINMSGKSTTDDVRKAYLYAFEKGLKGVTIYRDGSLESQVLTSGSAKDITHIKIATPMYPRPEDSPSRLFEFGAKSTVTGEKRPGVFISLSYLSQGWQAQKIMELLSQRKGEDKQDLEKKVQTLLNEYPPGRLNQLFITQGKPGETDMAHTESISRLISIGLQQGVPPQIFYKTMVGIHSDTHPLLSLSDGGIQEYLSIEDATAETVLRYLRSIGEPADVNALKDYFKEKKMDFPYQSQLFDPSQVGTADIISRKLADTSTVRLVMHPHLEGGLGEIFVLKGKSGGDDNAYTEALGKLVSIDLQYGVHPWLIVKTLMGIQSPQTAFVKGGIYRSLPDCLSREIEAWYSNMGVNLEKHFKDITKDSFGAKGLAGKVILSKPPCPGCGGRVYEYVPETRSCGMNSCCNYKTGSCG